MTEQITAQQMAGMSPREIAEAAEAGRLDAYLSGPPMTARPYTAPADADGRPVVQLSGVEVEALSAAEKVAALGRGQLAAYMAGDNDPVNPPPPEPPAPVRAAWQFTADHVALMEPGEIDRFRAEGKLADYDAAQAAADGAE